MPSLQEIIDALTVRLDEAQSEITSLEAARTALAGPPARRAARSPARPSATRRAPSNRSGARRSSSTRAASPSARPAETETPAASSDPEPSPSPERARRSSARRSRKESAAPAQTTPKPQPSDGTATADRPRRRAPRQQPGALPIDQIRDLLSNSEAGLSLVALAVRTGVSEANVRMRLRELERSGEARSTGSRRTSLWHLVSDEERIAERAAELARASRSAISQNS